MSLNDDNPEGVKKAGKKYLWLGYGSYSNYGFSAQINSHNMRADPSILNKLFEVFGVKEKTKEDPHSKKT